MLSQVSEEEFRKAITVVWSVVRGRPTLVEPFLAKFVGYINLD